MIAMGLGLMVGGMCLYAYVAADRAKSAAVTNNMLKVAGQRAMESLAKKLGQSRKVYERDAVTDAFLLRVPVKGLDASAGALSPGLPATPATDLELPVGKVDGSFIERLDDGTGQPAATANAAFDAASVGNALFFMTREPQVRVREASAGVQNTAFGTTIFRLNAYKFHFYYLGRKDLGLRRPARAGSAYTYELMHWESATYLDHREVENWMTGLTSANGAAAQTFITTKLAALRAADTGIAGAFRKAATAPDAAFYKLETSNYTTLNIQPTGTKFATGRFASGMPTGLQSTIGEAFVAFNTITPDSNAYPGVAIKGFSSTTAAEPIAVPAYADGGDVAKPFGFEVMIAGPPSGRRVLTRLALAARANGNPNLIGEVNQQVVQVFDN